MEIWTNGRRGCVACIQVSEYGDKLVASAEKDKITENQMMKALLKEYPSFSFQLSRGRGDGLYMEGIPCII